MIIKCPCCGDDLSINLNIIKSPRKNGVEVKNRFPPNWRYKDFGGKGFEYVWKQEPIYLQELIENGDVFGTLLTDLQDFLLNKKSGS